MPIYDFQQFLNEANFTGAANILRGDVPTIRTLGIITAENPMGVSSSAEDNNARNKELKSALRTSNFDVMQAGVRPLMGKWGGNFEHPILVPHISKNHLIQLASDFGQKAVIWGQRKIDERGMSYIDFEWIETSEDKVKAPINTYQTTGTRQVILANVPPDQDEFSAVPFPKSQKNKQGKKVQPRKFVIPFFDPDYESARYSVGKRTIDTSPRQIGDEDELRAAECVSNFFEILENNVSDIDIPRAISFEEEKLPKNERVEELIKEIKALEKTIYSDGFVGKHYWASRGNLRYKLMEMSRLVK